MEELLSTMNLCRVILLVAIAVSRGLAQDYCSLIVSVANPNGSQVSGVVVGVEEASGHSEAHISEAGEARFCGLGVSNVVVSVGRENSCGYVVVRNVPLAFGFTRRVGIIYDDMLCRGDRPPPILQCQILLRFRDQDGNWVPGVRLSPPIPHVSIDRSDSSGRIMVGMAAGEQAHSEAGKEGYVGQRIDLTCSRPFSERERIVTLQKAP
jgi:hypothetical protein